MYSNMALISNVNVDLNIFNLFFYKIYNITYYCVFNKRSTFFVKQEKIQIILPTCIEYLISVSITF